EGRLLVAVVGELLANVVELLGRGVRRDRLRPEFVLHLRREERPHLGAGIGSRGERRLHHEASVLQHLIARVALEQVARDDCGDGEPDGEDQQEHQVELDDQLHEIPSASSYCVFAFSAFSSSLRYFSGKSTRSHSGCDARFSISFARNAASFARLWNRSIRPRLTVGLALSQTSTSS